jgi:hypothetical protein
MAEGEEDDWNTESPLRTCTSSRSRSVLKTHPVVLALEPHLMDLYLGQQREGNA